MPRVIFLPGAFGNHNQWLAKWWFEQVSDALPSAWPRLFVSYTEADGRPVASLSRAVDRAEKLIRLWGASGETYVIAYSAGAQILRGLLARHPDLASRVVLLSGVGRQGLGNRAVVRTALAAPVSLALGLLTGTTRFRLYKELWRVLYSARSTDEVRAFSTYLTTVMPERMYWWIADLFLPGFRKHMPPIPANVLTLAVVPTDDLLIRDERYEGERLTRLDLRGLHHAFLTLPSCADTAIAGFHQDVRDFLTLPLSASLDDVLSLAAARRS